MKDGCVYPVEKDSTGESVAVCGDKVGLCQEGLCDYHCRKHCECGGYALVEPKEETSCDQI